jgi:hypothetical protein
MDPSPVPIRSQRPTYPEIALVLEEFGTIEPIAICDWLAEPNLLLDGCQPMHFWLTDRARVVRAAQRMTSVATDVGLSVEDETSSK